MQNKTPKIPFKTDRSGFECLIICGLGRDKNIAEIKLVSGERQHIGWFIETPVLMVVAPYHLICDEHHRERAFLKTELLYEGRYKPPQRLVVDCTLPLLIYEGISSRTFSLRFRLLDQTVGVAAAPCFARSMSHRLGRSAAPGDGEQHRVR